MKALFTSVPVDKALSIIENRLKADTPLSQTTSMSVDNIIKVLSFCLSSTCFVFKGEQVFGASMGSPILPKLANIYMEYFETTVLASCPHPPRIWKRYVDDTFVIIDKIHEESLFDHINSIDPHIQFTKEAARPNGGIPFLYILIPPLADGSLETAVYLK